MAGQPCPEGSSANVVVNNIDARKIILRNQLSPGDCLVMTAALECLHSQHKGKFVTGIECSCPAIFEHNPHATSLPEGTEVINAEYPLIHQCNQRPVSFLQGYTDFLSEKLGIPLTLNTCRPHLYLHKDEQTWMSQVQEITQKPTKYWVINAGVKQDFTTKNWGHDNYQTVVNQLRGKILFVQIGEAAHLHKPLDGVINLIGKTDARQLIRLCWNAQGGLGPTTFVQHIFAALERPYVCILGAREPVHWTHYPTQRTLSTQGSLSCCLNTACWKSRTVRLEDGNKALDESLCEYPVLGSDPRPRCMEMISPRSVVEAIESYYSGGRLSY